jgi:hypothetical protein
MLLSRLGTDQDRVAFELPLGTEGRRSEVAGMMVGGVDLQVKRVWIRQPVVELNNSPNLFSHVGERRRVVIGPLNGGLIGTGPPQPGGLRRYESPTAGAVSGSERYAPRVNRRL